MATSTLLSMEEFEQLDWGADDLELLRGELIRMPPPVDEHMNICERLHERLKTSVERLRASNPDLSLGQVHIERGYLINRQPNSWLRPDVSVTHPNQPVDVFLLGAPLIVFEVVSQSRTLAELDAKLNEYLANGAAEVWLLYYWKRHALVYEGSKPPRVEIEAMRTPLLPGIEIPFAEIFAE